MAGHRKIEISEQRRRLLDKIALSEEEYELIVSELGREPNDLELGMFGALWSEHCGYKHSKALLRLLPSKAPWVLTELGRENAGVISLDLALQGRCRSCKTYIAREGLCEVCAKHSVLCPDCGEIPTLWNDPKKKVLICDCGKTREPL